VNSASSVRRFGPGNPSRSYQVVLGWLEDQFKPYIPWVSFNTTVESVEKRDGEWVLTIRKSGQTYRGRPQDYWWQETFDAVVVATGHYNIANIPAIDGLREAAETFPQVFEHSKAYRSANKYVGKVGGVLSKASRTETDTIV
jgi:cation diffusion facilitator CzcD-associated flavoprotein CzcO